MSTVIKPDQTDVRLLKKLETVHVRDHMVDAARKIEAARREAEGVLAEAQRKADAIAEQAYRQGFKKGYRRGYASGSKAGYDAALQQATEKFENQQQNLIQTTGALIEAFEQVKEDIELTARSEVIEFALEVARRVTHRAAELDPEAAAANMQAALACVGEATDVRVRVHPDQVESMQRFARQLAERAESARHFSIEADASVGPGGCQVETTQARADATIDAQLDQITSLIRPPGAPQT